ncbi:MAG: DUF4058 family protein [Chloroflexi bacterium]|nr:DUF4058 family protein [Chloroflexota bacterium]MCC6893044.1 DUF4058 family protein [Anaerolineae bacterium]
MKPIRTVKNQYQGINAHLHSYWQAEHKWNRFHNIHIGDLLKLMRIQLLPMGYTAAIEDSLQIRRISNDVQYPKGDIVIRDTKPSDRPRGIPRSQHSTLVIEDLMLDDIDIDHPYAAIVIREVGSEESEPVAWVELLSPTNKGESKDARTYFAKRWALLETGIVFVELDYLHETPPTFDNLPDYTQVEPDSEPYRILILDSRLDLRRGPVDFQAFGVDDLMPQMSIPLNGQDKLEFDFGAAYQKTFEETLYGFETELDYAQIPVHFERYSPQDQTRIISRMITILKAQQAGKDLETLAPLPLESVELQAGLSELAKLTT